MDSGTESSTGVFSRGSSRAVVVMDGFGLSLTVSRGHLLVADGMGKHRRERRLPRSDREVRRIVILGHTGHLTLEAIRWCHDLGIAIIHLDTDGTTLLTAGNAGQDDARRRRAQAAAPAGSVGLEIARGLLTAKLEGQAAVAEQSLGAKALADTIRAMAEQLRTAPDLSRCRDLEARAGSAYFGGWSSTVTCRFAEREVSKLPDRWAFFSSRRSPLRRGGGSPRDAADPINAMLNYGYALAENEACLAALAVGLDPGLGIVHTDIRNRDSLALDLLEPLRPVVEQHVLQLLTHRYFTSRDFHETRQGSCRLLPPLTHELATWTTDYAAAIAPIAEGVAHALASSSPGKIALTTPLTRANYTAAQQRRDTGRIQPRPVTSSAVDSMPTCRSCGQRLFNKNRQLCTACWPITRAALSEQRSKAGQVALAQARAAGHDPTQTSSARAKRSTTLVATKAAEAAWAAAGSRTGITEQQLYEDVLPMLSSTSLRQIERATGLSNSSCSRIRSGKMTPHPRHWDALARLADRHHQ